MKIKWEEKHGMMTKTGEIGNQHRGWKTRKLPGKKTMEWLIWLWNSPHGKNNLENQVGRTISNVCCGIQENMEWWQRQQNKHSNKCGIHENQVDMECWNTVHNNWVAPWKPAPNDYVVAIFQVAPSQLKFGMSNLIVLNVPVGFFSRMQKHMDKIVSNSTPSPPPPCLSVRLQTT